MQQKDVERIAAEYAKSVGFAPFLIDGSDFDDSESPLIWRVYFSFCESSLEEIGLFDPFIIRVNDLTGEASHIMSL